MKKRKWGHLLLVVISVVTIISAIYIMINGLGLVDGLDFGAGAYYYADIPSFEKYVNGNAFSSHFPMWFHIALFLGWGYLMYALWSFLEKKTR